MQALSEPELFAALEQLPILVERLAEGTVRLGLLKPRSTREITSGTLSSLPFDRCYLVGRENCPPLFERNCPKASHGASALAKHRYLQIDNFDELREAVTVLQQLGWCVNNDAYIVDSAGRWLVYVSHHDTIFLDERNG